MPISLALPRPISALQVPLLFANNILALAVPPHYHFFRVAVSFPILVVLIAQSWYKERDPKAFSDDYALEILMLCGALTWVNWVGISMPDRGRWRKIRYSDGGGRKSKGGKGENGMPNVIETKSDEAWLEEYPTTFWKRLWWATRLASTFRHVGWNSQAKNTPMEVPGNYSRIRFIARKLLRIIVFFAAKDVLNSYIASSPYGTWADDPHPTPRPSLFEAPFWTRFFYMWIDIPATYFGLELYNAIVGVVQVALGMANPRDCPSAFGDLKELVSVRKLWAVVWHQQMRHIAGDPGIYLARDVLGLRKGSFASKYLQLFVAFAISGLAHAGGSMLIHKSLEGDAAMTFFVGQAVIILVEDHVIDFGKRLGFKDSSFWRLVGFLWVFLIMGTSLQQYQGCVIDRGLWIHPREIDILGIGPKI